MTNHHIVGSGNCARSGCYVEAVFDLQIKGKPQKKTLFLTPLAANQDVDVSFFNFKEATEDGKLKELKLEAVLSFDSTQDQKKLDPLNENDYYLNLQLALLIITL
jgi:hypothetical protein